MAQETGRFTPKKIDTPAGKSLGSTGSPGSAEGADAAAKAPAYASSGRYTPRGSLTPSSAASRTAAAGSSGSGIDLFEEESPAWVAWLMFAFFGLGLIIIVLNYAQILLPGAANNWYLLGGLGAIILGFITATKLK